MGEFHEHCPVILSQIRAIHPFMTFVFQNCPATNHESQIPLYVHTRLMPKFQKRTMTMAMALARL
jgi:hypothetical protein